MTKNVYQYMKDKKDKALKHDWYFEYAGCECGPYYGRDTARKMYKAFKNDYLKLLKKYNGGNLSLNIFVD